MKKNNEDHKIKIYFFLSNLSGGGAQRTIINIIQGIDMSKYEPKLLLLKLNTEDAFTNMLPDTTEIVNLNRRGRYAFWKIKKIIDNEKPDILFSTLSQVNFAVWLACKFSRYRPKLILRETAHKIFGINLNIVTHFIFKKMYNDANIVVALSKGIKNDLVELYDLPSEKVATIYNPVDIDYIYKASRENCSFKYTKKFKIVSCGRLEEQKNYPLIIKALSIIKDKGYDDFELFILGIGSKKEELSKMILQLGLENNIKLIGFKRNPYKYMAQADLFVLSSSFEGFGHVVVEAMASGTPVLSTNCPHGPKEILQDGKVGWLVTNNDYVEMSNQLIEIINCREKIDEKAVAIRSRTQDFDTKKIAVDYQKIFNKTTRHF